MSTSKRLWIAALFSLFTTQLLAATTYRVEVQDPKTGQWKSDQTYSSSASAQARAAALGQEHWVSYKGKRTKERYYQDGGTRKDAKKMVRKLEKDDFKDVQMKPKTARVRTISSSPTHFTFTNTSSMKVRLRIYNAKDSVTLIPKKVFNVNPGQTVTWGDSKYSSNKYHLKVYKPALKDKLLASSNNVPFRSKATFRSGGGGYSISIGN